MLIQNGHQGLKIYSDFIQKKLIVGSDHQIFDAQQPCGEATEVPLSADVWARPKEHFHVVFFCEGQEQGQVFVFSGVVELALLDLMVVPHHIHAESIQAKSLDHLNAMFPILDWDARVVDLAREQLSRNSPDWFVLLANAEAEAGSEKQGNESSSHLAQYYDTNILYDQFVARLQLLMQDENKQTVGFIDFYCNPECPSTLVGLKKANLIMGISLKVQRVWLTDQFSECKQIIDTLNEAFNLKVEWVSTLDQCIRLIKQDPSKTFQIVFSSLNWAEEMIKQTSQLKQVQKVIYCNTESKQIQESLIKLSQKHAMKNLYMANDQIELSKIMRSGNKNMNFVSFEDEFDKSDSQTANIQAMLNSELDRTIMIDKFIELIQLNVSQQELPAIYSIKEKYQKYRHCPMAPHQILKLYTSEGPFYKFINNSLRVLTNPVEIFYFWVVFYDLFDAITEVWKSQSENSNQYLKPFTCYRGATASEYELAYLRKATGKNIECLGFFSTSLQRSNAEKFATNALFEIEVTEACRINSRDFKYAFLQDFTENKTEKEVLFNPLNSFQVEAVWEEDDITIIKMVYGRLAEIQYRMKYGDITEQEEPLAAIIDYKNSAVISHAVNQGQGAPLKANIGLYSRFPYLADVAVEFYEHSIFLSSQRAHNSLQQFISLIYSQYYLAEVFKLRRDYHRSEFHALACSQMHLQAMLPCLSMLVTLRSCLEQLQEPIEFALMALRRQVLLLKFTGRLYIQMKKYDLARQYFTDILELIGMMDELGASQSVQQARLHCLHSLIQIAQKQANMDRIMQLVHQGSDICQLLPASNFSRRMFLSLARNITSEQFMRPLEMLQLLGVRKSNFAVLTSLAKQSGGMINQWLHSFMGMQEFTGLDGEAEDCLRLLRIENILQFGQQLEPKQIVQMSVDAASLSDKNMKYYISPVYHRCLYQLAHLYTYKLHEFYFGLYYLQCLQKVLKYSDTNNAELCAKLLVMQAEILAGFHAMDEVRKIELQLVSLQAKNHSIPNIGHLVEGVGLLIQFQAQISELTTKQHLMPEMRLIALARIRRISTRFRMINRKLMTIAQFFKVFEKDVPTQSFRGRSRVYEQIIHKQFFNVINDLH